MFSRTLSTTSLTGGLQSGPASKLWTQGVSPLSAEPVSTIGRDWILQDVLTQSTVGQLLLHTNMTLLSVDMKEKIF